MQAEAAEVDSVDQQLLLPARLPALAAEQRPREKAGLGAQAGDALLAGVLLQGQQQPAGMALMLMGGPAIEQGDAVGGLTHGEGGNRSVHRTAHQALPPLQAAEQCGAAGLMRPGGTLIGGVELGAATLHGLAIDLPHCIVIAALEPAQRLHVGYAAQFML